VDVSAEAAAAQGALPAGAGEGGGPNEVLVALLTAVPFAVAAFSTVGNAWHSKRSGERPSVLTP